MFQVLYRLSEMNRITKEVGVLVGPMLPYLSAVLWPIALIVKLLRGKTECRKILLVARNSIAADHFAELVEILKQDSNITACVTVDRFPQRGFTLSDAGRIVRVKECHIVFALMNYWNLIIFTNHPYGFGRCFAPFIRKLYINHGFHAGKINNEAGQDGVYGQVRVLQPFSRPYYDLMFAASEAEKELAYRLTPELHGRVKVVGYLRGDEFVRKRDDLRNTMRRFYRLDSSRKIVHVISTWGSSSLYEICGRQILSQAGELSEEYSFIISLHPRWNELSSQSPKSRDEILNEFRVAGFIVNEGLDWQGYVAMADAAVCDHSSLGLYHAVVGNPLLLVDVPPDQYVQSSGFEKLFERSKHLSNYDSLARALDDLFSAPVDLAVEEIMQDIWGERGMAGSNYMREIRRLMTK
jgi:hypothetical protein